MKIKMFLVASIFAMLTLFAAIALQAQVKPFEADNGKYGFKDKAGNIVTSAKYDFVTVLSENDGSIYGVAINKRYGFVSGVTGKQITALLYDDIDFFGDGFAMIKRGGVYGFINTEGKEVIPPKYGDVGGVSEGVYWFSKGGIRNDKGILESAKYGFSEITTGKEIGPAIYDKAENFKNGKAKVTLNGREFYIDKTGKEVLQGAQELKPALDYNTMKIGYADEKGNIVIKGKYHSAAPFSEGLASVCIEIYGWGFIDKTGKEVIPLKYGYAGSFAEGLAVVNIGGKSGMQYKGEKKDIGGKWGFIDKTGKEVITSKYEFAEPFKNGKAKVKLNGREFYIDKTEKEVKSNLL